MEMDPIHSTLARDAAIDGSPASLVSIDRPAWRPCHSCAAYRPQTLRPTSTDAVFMLDGRLPSMVCLKHDHACVARAPMHSFLRFVLLLKRSRVSVELLCSHTAGDRHRHKSLDQLAVLRIVQSHESVEAA